MLSKLTRLYEHKPGVYIFPHYSIPTFSLLDIKGKGRKDVAFLGPRPFLHIPNSFPPLNYFFQLDILPNMIFLHITSLRNSNTPLK